MPHKMHSLINTFAHIHTHSLTHLGTTHQITQRLLLLIGGFLGWQQSGVLLRFLQAVDFVLHLRNHPYTYTHTHTHTYTYTHTHITKG